MEGFARDALGIATHSARSHSTRWGKNALSRAKPARTLSQQRWGGGGAGRH